MYDTSVICASTCEISCAPFRELPGILPPPPGTMRSRELALCFEHLESTVEVTQPRADEGIGKALLVSHPE